MMRSTAHRSSASWTRRPARARSCQANRLIVNENSSAQFAFAAGTRVWDAAFLLQRRTLEAIMGRGLLLWLIGIPLPIILVIWLFGGLN
jgi:hypothetical protein